MCSHGPWNEQDGTKTPANDAYPSLTKTETASESDSTPYRHTRMRLREMSPPEDSPLREAKRKIRVMASYLAAAEKAHAQLADLARQSGWTADTIASELNVSKRFAELLLKGESLRKILTEDSRGNFL